MTATILSILLLIAGPPQTKKAWCVVVAPITKPCAADLKHECIVYPRCPQNEIPTGRNVNTHQMD